MRLISSQSFQPTSEIQISWVPGRRAQPEGVAEAVGDDEVVARHAVVSQRIVRRHLRAGRGGADVDAQHAAVVALRDRPTVRMSWLRSAPPWELGGAGLAPPGIAAGVHRAAVLPPVDEVEARAVAGARVEHAVGAEHQVAGRVARVLLAPVALEERHLSTLHRDGIDVDAREPALHHAAVVRRTRRRRTRIAGDVRRAPARRGAAGHRIVGVERVEVRASREARVDRQAEQAAVPEVVHLRAQVDDGRRRGVADAVEHQDHAALLGHEDLAVRREAHGRRLHEAADHRRLLEAAGKGAGGGGAGREPENGGQQRSRGAQDEHRGFLRGAAPPGRTRVGLGQEKSDRHAAKGDLHHHLGPATHAEAE